MATHLAGSHGAESDAGHAYSDSAFIFVSVFLSLWKRYRHDRAVFAEISGIVLNSLFLFIAAGVILYRLAVHHDTTAFSALFMLATGGIGVAGNATQLFVLGHDHGDHVSMLSTTSQHLWYDLFYSLAVVVAACIALVTASTRIDEVVAVVLSIAMIVSATRNLLKLPKAFVHLHLHGHRHH